LPTKVGKLYTSGLTGKQISEQLGIKISNVYSYLYRYKYRRPVGSPCHSTIVRRAIAKYGDKCMICGFHRAIDIAHNIAKKNGGTDEISNLYVLCPNHHRLYDSNKLTIEELKCLQ